MVNKICAILALLFVLPFAEAATYNVSAGASSSTINSTLATAAAASGSNTVLFAAGSYPVTANMNIPCPASGTLTVSGPTVPLAYYTTGDGYGHYGYTPTAIFNPNSTVATSTWGFSINACSNPIILQYVTYNGGNQNPDGGGAVYVATGAANVTIQYNYFYGTWANSAGGNEIDGNIFFDGDQGSSQSSIVATGNTVQWNRFGAGNDCANAMSGEAYDGGSESNGGFCNGIGVYGSTTNFTVQNNVFYHLEQGMKFFENTSSNLYYNTNRLIQYNDFSGIHRIGIESQTVPVSGGSLWNVFRDAIDPQAGSWSISFAENSANSSIVGNSILNNLFVWDVAVDGNPVNGAGPTIEFWGGSGNFNNNLSQGYAGCGMQFGYYYNMDIQFNIMRMYNVDTYGYTCNEEGVTTYPVGSVQAGNFATYNYGVNSSGGSSWQGTLTSQTPTISPNGGSFSSSQVVTLTNNGWTGSTNIGGFGTGYGPQGNTSNYYTTDGSTPVPGQGTTKLYTGPFTITSTTTVKTVGMYGAPNQALSYAANFGFIPSSVASATFTGGGTPTAATPTFTPASESFTGTVSVTLASTTSGSSIYYCETSGCTPTTSSTLYTGALSISATTTVNAIAVASGFVNSSIGSATYTLTTPGQAATPTFTPAGETFTGTVSVAIATTTPSPTIYYTTNGSTPTTSSPVYSGPLTVSATQTIKAIANASGYTTSAVGSATYTLAQFLGQNQEDTVGGGTYPGSANAVYAVTGSSSGGYNVTGCVINQGTATITPGSATACFLTLANSPTTQGSTALCEGSATNSGSTGAVLNITMSGCPTLPANTAYWVNSVTNDPAAPSALGFYDCGGTCAGSPPTSNVGTYPGFFFSATYGSYSALPTTLSQGIPQATQYLTLSAVTSAAATPVFAPGSSTITGTTSVTITSATSGASIYYCTTSGCTPTTSSTLYTGAISVSTTTTISAIAVAGGMTNSAVATATYTLSTGTVSSVYFTSGNGANYVTPGTTAQMTVNIQYSDGTMTTLQGVGTIDVRSSVLTSLTSSNTAVATLSRTGIVAGVSNTVSPNWTLLTAVVTDSGGGTHTANWIEGVGQTLVSGIN